MGDKLKQWQATMPANIAWIKYMGKQAHQESINPSLSYTLDQYTTTVTLTLAEKTSFEAKTPWPKTAQDRFIKHLNYLKLQFNITEHFCISSLNNFASDCGLASSASSFAALTQSFFNFLACQQHDYKTISKNKIAYWSTKGSGSSGRSFFKPWAIWDGNTLSAIELPYQNLEHVLLMVDHSPKLVSSSEAHIRIRSSLLYKDRAYRAQERYHALIDEMKKQNWSAIRSIVWAEFQDMHALFHTAEPSFSYFHANTTHCLNILQDSLLQDSRGPVITMDAGCNIHLLFNNQDTIADYIKILTPFCQIQHQ